MKIKKKRFNYIHPRIHIIRMDGSMCLRNAPASRDTCWNHTLREYLNVSVSSEHHISMATSGPRHHHILQASASQDVDHIYDQAIG